MLKVYKVIQYRNSYDWEIVVLILRLEDGGSMTEVVLFLRWFYYRGGPLQRWSYY